MRAKKNLSQNFLVNNSIAKRIVESLASQEKDILLEVGPGKGALTQYLVEKPFATLYLFEKDMRLIPGLQEKYPKALVQQRDILEVDLAAFLPKKAKILSNLPYHITKPFLLFLLKQKAFIQSAHLLLQKEVVEKISSVGSLLGGLYSFFAKVTPLFTVSKKNFSPEPKVHSALVKIEFFPTTPYPVESVYRFLQKLYLSKRKTLFNNLQSVLPKENIALLLQELHIDNRQRIESLPKEKLVALYLAVEKAF